MKKRLFFVLFLVFVQSNAYASGFEKAVTWSGRYGGMANAATSSAKGAEALYFNPAGIVGGESEFAFNISPSFIQLQGPFLLGEEKSDTVFTPPFSVIGSFKRDKMAFAAGIFAVAGNAADYGVVDFNSEFNSFDPEIKAQLSAIEFSIGMGYQLSSELSLGIAWRATVVTGELKFAQYNPGASFFAAQMTDLSDTDFTGFRAGLMYQKEKWGLGLTVRTPVEFRAKGEATGQLETAATGGTFIPLTSLDVSASAMLPLSIALGAHYKVSELLTFFGDLAWYNYEQNDALELSGTLVDSSGTIPVSLSNSSLEWKNGVALRLAGEYRASWPIRFGYVYGSPIASKGLAQPILESPGAGHVFTLGSGYPMSDRMEFNFAFEYSLVSATVEAADVVSTLPGDYKTTSYAAHLGMKWMY